MTTAIKTNVTFNVCYIRINESNIGNLVETLPPRRSIAKILLPLAAVLIRCNLTERYAIRVPITSIVVYTKLQLKQTKPMTI